MSDRTGTLSLLCWMKRIQNQGAQSWRGEARVDLPRELLAQSSFLGLTGSLKQEIGGRNCVTSAKG
jgi:hypothetical protein